MANPMIEKIARAMAAAEGHDPDQPVNIASAIMGQTAGVRYSDDPAWTYYVAIARAVLVAIQTERGDGIK